MLGLAHKFCMHIVFVGSNFTLELIHYRHQTLEEDMLEVEEEMLVEKKRKSQEEKVNVIQRPLNQVGLHWLWQVEQAQTIRLAVALLLRACHPIFAPLKKMALHLILSNLDPEGI